MGDKIIPGKESLLLIKLLPRYSVKIVCTVVRAGGLRVKIVYCECN
jgi:hypothetical protein